MKGLSSLERVIVECISHKSMDFQEIKTETGLFENVCFNILQALVIKGLIQTNGKWYKLNKQINPSLMDDINSEEAKKLEVLEWIEAIVDKKNDRVFRFQKVSLNSQDETILNAMISNLEVFLQEANKRADSRTYIKDKKIIFWGVGKVDSVLGQLLTGE